MVKTDECRLLRLKRKYPKVLDGKRIKYYEVCFRKGARRKVICIRGIRQPSIEEASEFCKPMAPKGMKVSSVLKISSATAHYIHIGILDQEPNIFGVSPSLENNDTRPLWDEYFLRLAEVVATRSNCSSRKVGAVITKDNLIVSTGYNGTPAKTTNCFNGGCPRCNGDHKPGDKLDECLCVHAEQNAICQAAKHGNSIDGGSIYVTCSPCLTCLKLIINSGIRKVVFGEWYRELNEQEKNLIRESGITVKKGERNGNTENA